jgi:Holliday junction DNA helicase RuvA
MFYYLEGVVAVIETNLTVVDIGGAGYACHTTMNTISRLEIGKKARLYTYCNIREDAFDIYGFIDPGEKRFFEQLLAVSGIGPKAALSILSSGTPETLALAIVTGDEKALTLAPGIGKKIAQRVILELKDKIAKDTNLQAGAGMAPAAPAMGAAGVKVSDASSALAVLGYSQSEIAQALRGMDTDNMSVEEIIRDVLKGSL